jgi:hypothetical protein
MNVATAGQWFLLGGYTFLLIWALIIGRRAPRLRPIATAAGSIAFTHVWFYATFLFRPDWLGYDQTMMFSIAIRLQVLFIVLLGLGIIVRRGRWRR